MKKIRPLVMGFPLLFLPFHAVERHFAPSLAGAEGLNMALLFLSVAYLFLFIGDFVFPMFVDRLGHRACLMLGSLFYSVFLAAVGLELGFWPILFTSVLGGFAAALVWGGMATYVARVLPDPEEMGMGFGQILSFYGLGSALGMVGFALLLPTYGFQTLFIWLAPIPLLAALAFSRLPKQKLEMPPLSPADIAETYRNGTILRMATLSFTTFVVYALLVGAIPLHIQEILGNADIGLLSSGAFFTLMLCNWFGAWTYQQRNLFVHLGYSGFILGLVLLFFGGTSGYLVAVGTLLVCVAYAALFLIMFSMMDAAPPHRIECAAAVFQSADDLAVFGALLLTMALDYFGFDLKSMYPIGIAIAVVSYLSLFPLIRRGKDLDEARERLARDFPL